MSAISVRYGVISKLTRGDEWILRQFRSELDEARAAASVTALEILDLGWADGRVAIVSFDLGGLSHYNSAPESSATYAGELAIILREPDRRQLAITVVVASQMARDAAP